MPRAPDCIPARADIRGSPPSVLYVGHRDDVAAEVGGVLSDPEYMVFSGGKYVAMPQGTGTYDVEWAATKKELQEVVDNYKQRFPSIEVVSISMTARWKSNKIGIVLVVDGEPSVTIARNGSEWRAWGAVQYGHHDRAKVIEHVLDACAAADVKVLNQPPSEK